jgi:PQQ-dependent dehydrogenase (methanol/ethanol family)
MRWMEANNMRISRQFKLLSLVALFAVTIRLAALQQSRQVDDGALADAGKTGEEWITYNINWAEQRYSPLNQINATNVSKLVPAWSADIPAAPGPPQNRQEGTPLVFDGVLYSITPWSVVYAVDARTGKELWHNDPEVNQQVWQSRICCGVVNRGIAMYQGKIIAPVVDGRLRALDMKDGKVVWETRVSPENMAYTITHAPRVIKGGKVIVGVSGGEYGVRGFFSAYDTATGQLMWRFYTVPGDPSKPFEHPELEAAAKTWSGEWWKIGGGGGVWGGIAYDPDADLVYVATGQPAPWTSVYRGPGDNLYSDCIIAVRGATGKMVWYYQEVPGDDWDLDSIADMTLADLTINDKPRKVIMHAPKDGYFYVLDRRTGELLSADPWVQVNWSSGVNLKTGRPTINPEARYGTTSINVMPGPAGGHTWPPMSFNPQTGLIYLPSTTGQGYGFNANPNYTPVPTDIGPTGRGQMNMATGGGGGGRGGAGRGGAAGGRGVAAGGAAQPLAPGLDPGGRGAAPATGAAAAPANAPAQGQRGPAIPTIGPEGRGTILVAWDPVAQKERWRGAPGSSLGFNAGGTLTTAGNLVFSSAGNPGRVLAFKADTGELLYEVPTGLSQMGPPMTFMLGGKQYLVVAGGPAAAGGGRGGPPAAGGGRGGAAPAAPAGPPQPSKLMTFVLP